MIQTIDNNQGSVLKFAGDALISHFNSTEKAVRCSVALIQCLNGFRATEEDELGFHVAVVQVDDLKGEVLGDEEEKVRERERVRMTSVCVNVWKKLTILVIDTH